tara:strand:- start:207 stop:542 length:336 start_codon:yes stop_codon:yes gene_type:complete
VPIITTYPFKKDPLNKKDEIIVSDYTEGLKTKTTSLDVLNSFIVSKNTFEFTQSAASDTWVVEHNLDKFPSVTVADSQPEPKTVIGNITYNTRNKCTITFSAPFSGKAFCN